MPRVLHVVAARAKPGVDAEARDRALALAHALREAPAVEAVIVAASEERIIVATWLPGREALEPFAASTPHMQFVMRGLAPMITGMWSASVETEAGPPPAPAALWVFALGAADVYEWQVREMLGDVAALPGHAAAGPTVEERERYRAGGAVALAFAEVGPFEEALRERRTAWAGLAEALEE
ncbi:MAG: hypothetical protein FJZ92_02530, partial [Chloroflexi bacterium]|nr:hypothetical protein [Chloroflexota bacterium]